ncbi:hypothetical protein ACKI1J_14875 [Streptomyces scabiei]|uniref:hypothetical protein n=1 Tax=Streptomyces scabiei TaxID=1930 RepID=UPI0038F5D35B
MTDETAAMVEFLRARYAEGIAHAREFGNLFVTNAEESFGVSREQAERQTRASLHAAELRSRLLEETVAPYLGTGGPTGRIVEQQLRLLAWEHVGHADFDERWAP